MIRCHHEGINNQQDLELGSIFLATNENWQLEWSFLIVVQGLDEWICFRGEKKKRMQIEIYYTRNNMYVLYSNARFCARICCCF